MTKPKDLNPEDRHCTARNREGTRCGRWAMKGQNVCAMHGGKAPQAREAAARRVADTNARAAVARLGGRRDIHPAEALLDLVHWTAGEVDYWRQRVTQLEEDQLTWGTTQHREGTGPEGPIDVTTQAAAPHIAYTMLERASDRLASYATAALKAGVDERRVRLAEQQGALVAGVIRAILAELNLSPAQQALVGEVVPRQLRALNERSTT